jgi:N-formylglutamate amidohydrolase
LLRKVLDREAYSETIDNMRDSSQAVQVNDSPGADQDRFESPFTHSEAIEPAAAVLFASPHSGSIYPPSMVEALCVPLIDVRRTEDAFVDSLFSDAPRLGASLVSARYGRSVVDLNRDPHELDAAMFVDGPPRPCALPTARVEAGLGCLPRVGARGEAIYRRLLSRAEGEARLSFIHDAYHGHLSSVLGQLGRTGRHVLLIDCHSMPSTQPGRRTLTDIVLGDRFGSSIDPRLIGRIERSFRAQGFSVARNAPYAGGYTTRRYGRPRRGLHALQIEVNRGLYLDEHRVVLTSGFAGVKQALAAVIADIVDMTRALPAN